MANVNMDKIMDNSNKAKLERKNAPIEQNQNGAKKRSMMSKAVSEIFVADLSEAAKYAWHEKVIPGAKTLFISMLEYVLFGESKVRQNKRPGTFTNYSQYYKYKNGTDTASSGSSIDRQTRKAFSDYEEYVFSAAQAETILDKMVACIDMDGWVGVDDLYNFISEAQGVLIIPASTDYNYGWKNLSRAKTKHVFGGYILDLPDPIVLNK